MGSKPGATRPDGRWSDGGERFGMHSSGAKRGWKSMEVKTSSLDENGLILAMTYSLNFIIFWHHEDSSLENCYFLSFSVASGQRRVGPESRSESPRRKRHLEAYTELNLTICHNVPRWGFVTDSKRV